MTTTLQIDPELELLEKVTAEGPGLQLLSGGNPDKPPNDNNDERIPRDIEIDQFVLDLAANQKQISDLGIRQRITAADIERTIEGASTITVTLNDADRKLLKSGAFGVKIDVHVDAYWYRLDGVQKNDDELSITFIDRDVAYLRERHEVKRAARGKMTRAEFCFMLAKLIKKGSIKVVCPELHKKQPESATKREVTKSRKRAQGINPNATINVRYWDGTVKRADKTQIHLMELILDQGVRMGASDKVLICSLMTVMIESGVRNLVGGDRDSRGLFQQRPSMGWPASRIPEKDAAAFFRKAIAIDKKDSKIGYGALCQKVQVSAFPGKYQMCKPQAQHIVQNYNGERVSRRVVKKAYRFSTEQEGGKPQNWWDAIGRLMDQVHWRRFMSNGVLYLISEEDLFKSRPRLYISEDVEGIHRINYTILSGTADQGDNTVTVTAQAKRWEAPPGTIVQIFDMGPPADGRWLVSNIQRSMFSPIATIVLKKPMKELPEPAPATKVIGSTQVSGFNAPGTKRVDAMWQKAKAIHAKHYPYVWGGGHASAGKPSGGGYDCSGSVGAVLAAGHFHLKPGDSVPASGSMAHWGVPGKGKFFTIYANNGHVYMEFKRNGKWEHFGTGDWGKGWRGAGFNSRLHPHGGFAARHFPGY